MRSNRSGVLKLDTPDSVHKEGVEFTSKKVSSSLRHNDIGAVQIGLELGCIGHLNFRYRIGFRLTPARACSGPCTRPDLRLT